MYQRSAFDMIDGDELDEFPNDYAADPAFIPNGYREHHSQHHSNLRHHRPHRTREIQSDFGPDPMRDDLGAGSSGSSKRPGGRRFLSSVQHELEEQRQEWQDEVDRLTQSSLVTSIPRSASARGTNSFVDTSGDTPIFKAFVDVSEFPRDTITVSMDNVQNKVVVQAGHNNDGRSTLTKTFTQKVQLPRYADDKNIRSFVSKSGVMKIEVPLIYYFPQESLQRDGSKPAKSFVNEVKTRPDGQQCLEILVNTGTDYSARDLHVRVVDDDKLIITAERPSATGSGRVRRRVIKQYTLPKLADVDGITSKLARDGRLAVTVPLRRSSRETTPMSTPLPSR